MAKSALGSAAGAKRKPPKSKGQKLVYCLFGFLGSYLLVLAVVYISLLGTESPAPVLQDSLKELGYEISFHLAFEPKAAAFPEGLGAPSDYSLVAGEAAARAAAYSDSAAALARGAQVHLTTAVTLIQMDPASALAHADSALMQVQYSQTVIDTARTEALLAVAAADTALARAVSDSALALAKDARTTADSTLARAEMVSSEVSAMSAQIETLRTQAGLAQAKADSLAKLAQEEEAIRQTPVTYDLKRVRQLARIFSSMEPSNVASIISQMDDETIVAVLIRVRDRQAGSILSVLEPSFAADLSRKMVIARAEETQARGRQGMARR